MQHPSDQILGAFSDGTLPTADAAPLREHVRDCDACREKLAALAFAATTRDPGEIRRGWTGALLSPRPTPLVGLATPRLAAGSKMGRFTVERFVAEGGMGQVYAARDPELGRAVALKLLREPRAAEGDSAGHHARLLREAQAMARLAHPNVVTVHELGEVDGRLFVAMELVEGPGLRQWMQQPRSVDEVLDVFIAAGRGLAAAHAAGIVHRDFKPDNVLLGADGRARVTDFGLARPAKLPPAPAAPTPRSAAATAAALAASSTPLPDATLTPLGALAGTPAYMAPEQLRGEPSDARSDLFAFCATLWEALTGARPYSGRTIWELSERIAREQLSASPAGRRIPRWLRRVLLQGLRADPAQRIASMEALLAAIESGRIAARRRRSLGAMAAAAAVLAVVGAAAWARRAPSAGSGPPPRRSVAVLAPAAPDGGGGAPWLGRALAEMLSTELASAPRLRVVPGETVALAGAGTKAAPTPAELRRLRAQLSADLVVAGSWSREGAGPPAPLRLELRLWDAATGEALATASERGDEGHLFELAARAAARLRAATGDSSPGGQGDAFPADPEAARLTATGLSLLRAFDVAGARTALEEAARRAPDHPKVLGALAETLLAQGDDTKAGEVARRLLERSAGLGREERLRAQLLERRAAHDRAKSIEIATALWTFFPDDVEAGLRLAREQTSGRQFAAALETIAGLRRLPPPANGDARIDWTESEAALGAGDTNRAIAAALRGEAAAEARGLPAVLARARYAEAEARRNAGEPEKARVLFEKARAEFEALGDRAFVARSATMHATLLADAGDLPGARRDFESAIATFRELGNRNGEAALLHNLGILLRRARELPAATASLEQARRVYDSLGDRFGASNSLSVLANLKQDAGDLEGARELSQESVSIRREIQAPLLPVSLGVLAGLRLEQGAPAEARALCEEAIRVRKPGDKLREANGHHCLGEVELADGRPAEALPQLREAVARFAEAGQRDEAALAEASQARALLALAKPGEARAAAERAQGLIAGSKSGLARATVATALARTAVAQDQSAQVQARAALASALAESERSGVVPDQLEVRLALGELDASAGRPGAAAALRALSAEAHKRGFELLARRAGQAAAPPRRTPREQPLPQRPAQPEPAGAVTNAPERARNPRP